MKLTDMVKLALVAKQQKRSPKKEVKTEPGRVVATAGSVSLVSKPVKKSAGRGR